MSGDIWGIGATTQAVSSGYHAMRVAKEQKKRFKRARAAYTTTMAPVYNEYLAALRGEWNPQTQALWTGRAESIGKQATAAKQGYLEALAARGLTGGATITGARRLAEQTGALRTQAWRDIDLARYQEALQGVTSYASNLANLQTGMATAMTPAYQAADPSGIAGAVGGIGDTIAMLLALRGGEKTPSLYGSNLQWGTPAYTSYYSQPGMYGGE